MKVNREDYKGKSQAEKIILYCKEFGSITSLDGVRDLGIMRVPNRISELRQKGYVFDQENVSAPNRWGERTSFVRYRLVKEAS